MPNDAPNNDDSSSILAPPPRAHSERAQFTDYRRAGEHRDIQRFRDSQRTGSSLTELAAAARHHSHRQRGSHDFQHLRRHNPRGGPDQERDRHHRRRRRHRSDDFDPLVDKFSAKVNLLCCVFHPTQHRWSTAPVCFDRVKHDDCDVWYLIRDVYRGRLQPAWRRWLGFKKLVAIVPIVYTSQGVPVRTKVDDYPVRHSFMHAYHHPDRLQPDRAWMDWFTAFREGGDAGKTYGLEFVEGLWIEKLAVLAVVLTLGMVTASLVWGLKGGSLDTIFTTMDFVESGFAAIIALMALYYQMVLIQ